MVKLTEQDLNDLNEALGEWVDVVRCGINDSVHIILEEKKRRSDILLAKLILLHYGNNGDGN